MQDKIEEVLPQEGTLAKFVKYTGGTEICPRFRFFAMAAAIGAILRRKVSFQRSTYNLFPTLYPNLWVILVAPQGRGHKSSALRMAKTFLDKLPLEHQPTTLASKLTPEALIKSLASQTITAEMAEGVDPNLIKILKKKAQGLIYSSELGVFLGKEKYNQGMIALLTDLYDCPDAWTSETIMRGDQMLYEVCISVMGASTPDWMQTMLPSDTFKGGFMSRLLLIAFPEGWNKRIADPPPPDEQLGKEILNDLIGIAKMNGQMKWTKEGKEFFEDWYMNLPEEIPGPRAAYLERKQDHMLRLAMIIEASITQKLVLRKESIELSLSILNSIEPETLKMIDYIATEPRMRIIQRVSEIMESQKEMAESELLAHVWKDLGRAGEFAEVVQLMLKAKMIEVFLKGTQTWYKWTKSTKEDVK